jgi:predicted secreted protein
MQLGSVLAVYFIIWWLTLFIVLPFGIRSQQEAGQIVSGSDPGAPSTLRIARIVLTTTFVSGLFFGLFWLIYVLNIFDLAAIRDLQRG